MWIMPNPIVEEFLTVSKQLEALAPAETGNADDADAADLAQESFARWLDFNQPHKRISLVYHNCVFAKSEFSKMRIVLCA